MLRNMNQTQFLNIEKVFSNSKYIEFNYYGG
jgi:hypothetical protein